MPGILLLFLYVIVALAPLVIAWLLDLPARPFLDDLSSGLALVATSVLLMEFVLSGRFRPISGRTGIDATMRFHQLVARPMTIVLLLHPFLYTTPLRQAGLPWDVTGQASLGLTPLALITGLVAWVLLGALVLSAIFRDSLSWRYEAWRLSHGAGAALIAGFGVFHALEAGRYSSHPSLAALWLALFALAVLTLVIVYLVRPLLKLWHPYRVTAVERRGLKIWEVAIEPVNGSVMSFEAGQFVWLTLDRPPYSFREHPFSIASAPHDPNRMTFLIKEVGDFTRRIGEVPVGARAYVDGPHGALTLKGATGTGIVFLAGGVGVAPILSMLRQCRADQDKRPMTLIYGNRVEDQILYRDELEALTDALDLTVVHVLSEPPSDWDGSVGVMNDEMIHAHCDRPDKTDWLYVVCGPPPMIDATEDALVAMGIPERQVISEKFAYD